MGEPLRLHWSALAVLETFGRASSIGRDRYMRIAALEVEPTAEEDEALRRGLYPLGLTSSHLPSTVEPMPSSELSTNALRSHAQLTKEVAEHRFVKAMVKKGLTFAEVADSLGEHLGRKVPRSSLLSWVKPKGDVAARGIPEDAAEALRALYGVPLTAWRRVIPKA